MLKTMSSETKIFLGIIITTILLIGGAMFFFSKQNEQETMGFTREQLVDDHNYLYGNASASAYLVEFSDFQCPACAAYEPVIKQLREQYNDKLQFIYRHYPLPQHPYAEKAALAAEAAGKQGKFWEMHDQLFVRQESLSDETVNEIVKSLGLNEETFKKDLEDQNVKDNVASDKSAGNSLGVNSTPTFFLNGKKLRLLTPQTLAQEVEKVVQ